MLDLYWLPECPNWKESLAAAREAAEPWPKLVELARKRLDFVKTNQLDQLLLDSFTEQRTNCLPTKPIRLAVLSSSTATHLLPG